MKLGLDIHGVADEGKKFFSELTSLLVANGHEVHVITGPRVTQKLVNELKDFGIVYTHLFSITDFHLEKGTKIEWDDKGNPHLDPYLWDRTKGDYCLQHQIDLHLDDSDSYAYFFKTPFARYLSKNKRVHYVREYHK